MPKQKLSQKQQERISGHEANVIQLWKDNPQRYQQGLVTVSFGRSFDVCDVNSNTTYRCAARRTVTTPVVGDHVLFKKLNHNDEWVIEVVLPRASLLKRYDRFNKEKLLAANVDHIAIVIAPLPEWDERLLNCYLLAAIATEITPIIVVNKMDLLEVAKQEELRKRLSNYESLGYQLFFTSTKQSNTIDALCHLLSHSVTVFVGQSGVGKSSLIQQVLPDEHIMIGDVSDQHDLGCHTTSVSRYYAFKDGGVIDSPGVRDFNIDKVDAVLALKLFPDIDKIWGKCLYRNCSHDEQTGCAIQEAITLGELSQKRWEHFLELINA